jgi:purine-binding chemotaxis protein CheW
MDISKVRKKFKEASEQEAGKPGEAPEETPRGVEEVISAEAPVRTESQTQKREPEAGDESADVSVQLLAFRLAREEYAFRIDEIEEIVRPQGITPIPNTEPYLLGIASLRGKIIPVIDLKKMLSLSVSGEDDNLKRKILILKGPKGPIGALVDRVAGVISLSVSRIVETPLHLPDAEMRFIEGVALVDGRFVSVIRLSEAAAI